jgi:hypothetical protein
LRECSSCQAVNDDSAQFCLECGQKLAPPRGGGQPGEQAGGGRKRLHSPILGGYEDVDDTPRRPAEKGQRPAAKGKPAHLRSPLLGGADDDYEEDSEEPVQGKPGKGKPQPQGKGGKMRSPLLGGGGGDPEGDYEEDFPLRDRNNDHTPFPHRSRPAHQDPAPKAPPAQSGGGGKAHLRSPLLGGDDEYEEDQYEQPAARGGHQPASGQPQRPQKLHSPIFDRGGSSGGGGGLGDYYDDDEPEEIMDPNVLRSPLLAAKARVPLDRAPKPGDVPPNQPNPRTAPQQPYGQPPAQPGFPQQTGFGAQLQVPAANIQQPGAMPGGNFADPFTQVTQVTQTQNPQPMQAPAHVPAPTQAPAPGFVQQAFSPQQAQAPAAPLSPFSSPPLNTQGAGFAPPTPSPNALQSSNPGEPGGYEFGAKSSTGNPVFLTPPAPLGQVGGALPQAPAAPLLPDPQFAKPDVGTASGASMPSASSPRKDFRATLQEKAVDISSFDEVPHVDELALSPAAAVTPSPPAAPAKSKLKSSRFSSPAPEPDLDDEDDFDAKPAGKKGLPAAGRRFDSPASDHSIGGGAAPGGAAMIVFVTAFFAIIAKAWYLFGFLSWWLKQPMPMLLDQVGQMAIFIGLAVWAVQAAQKR